MQRNKVASILVSMQSREHREHDKKKTVKWPIVYLTRHLTNTVKKYSVNCILNNKSF